MPKLTKKSYLHGWTDGQTYGRSNPNYRKAETLKIQLINTTNVLKIKIHKVIKIQGHH